MISEIKKAMVDEWDETYPINLIGVNHDNGDVVLKFDLVEYCEPTWVRQKWEIKCVDYIKCSHNFDFCTYESIDEFDEHIFLWDVTKDRYELYFNSKPLDLASFLGDLYIAHKGITNGKIPFGKYMVGDKKEYYYDFDIDLKLIQDGYGMFAAGPEPIMMEYENILRKHAMKPNLLASNLYYQDIGQKSKYKVIVFGNSYIIAKEFVECRLL